MGVAARGGVSMIVDVVIDIDGSEGEWNHTSSSSHISLAELPVHGLCCSPGDSHFLRDLGPHLWLESVIMLA